VAQERTHRQEDPGRHALARGCARASPCASAARARSGGPLPHFGDGQSEWNTARAQRVLGRRENPFERNRLRLRPVVDTDSSPRESRDQTRSVGRSRRARAYSSAGRKGFSDRNCPSNGLCTCEPGLLAPAVDRRGQRARAAEVRDRGIARVSQLRNSGARFCPPFLRCLIWPFRKLDAGEARKMEAVLASPAVARSRQANLLFPMCDVAQSRPARSGT